MKGPEGESPNHREINKQLARARRMGYRKEEQTLPYYIPPERNTAEATFEEAEEVIFTRLYKDALKEEEQELAQYSPEELERLTIEASFDDLMESPTMSSRITRALVKPAEILALMHKDDPVFMEPIITAMEKRPKRIAKAKRAIRNRGINPGVDEYGEYIPLWDRF
jgi:hypothetical protein